MSDKKNVQICLGDFSEGDIERKTGDFFLDIKDVKPGKRTNIYCKL